MLCAAVVGPSPSWVSFERSGDEVAGLLTAFRPVSRESQPPNFGPPRDIRSGAVSSAGCCATASELSAAVVCPSDADVVICWITNLWRGERRDDMTLNRAPLIEHLNATSLS